MTPAEHYNHAESLLDTASRCGGEDDREDAMFIEMARVHAILATVPKPTALEAQSLRVVR